jgi:hypothetical protein
MPAPFLNCLVGGEISPGAYALIQPLASHTQMLADVASSTAVRDVYFPLVGPREDRSVIGSDTPRNACPKPASYGGPRQSRRFVSLAGGFAVCGFSATLTRDLYICCPNGLTGISPYADDGLSFGARLSRRSFITHLAGSSPMLPAFFACGAAPWAVPPAERHLNCPAERLRGRARRRNQLKTPACRKGMSEKRARPVASEFPTA